MPCFLVVTGKMIKRTSPILRHNGPIQHYFGYLSTAHIVQACQGNLEICSSLFIKYGSEVLHNSRFYRTTRYKKIKVNARECGGGGGKDSIVILLPFLFILHKRVHCRP